MQINRVQIEERSFGVRSLPSTNDVCFGSIATVLPDPSQVRFAPDRRHTRGRETRQRRAKGRHYGLSSLEWLTSSEHCRKIFGQGKIGVSKLTDVTPEDWAFLRRQWFGSVYEIADICFQRRTWLTPPTSSPHWSYVEFRCSYPDADQLQFARGHGHLSSKEFDLLSALGAAIHSYRANDDYDNTAILEDPGWHSVVAKAETIRQRLLAITMDTVERKYLTEDMGAA
jgi:hypothetical protein